MSDDDSPVHPPFWSEKRQTSMTALEQRLYSERAGLAPEEAFTWWDHDVLSREAADAIEAGRSLDEEIELRGDRVAESKDRRERIAADQVRAVEQQLRSATDERDRLAEQTDFLDGLSPEIAELVARITSVELFTPSACDGALYPDDAQVVEAIAGRMKVTVGGVPVSPMGNQFFDTTIHRLLEVAADRGVRAINFVGLQPTEGAELICSPEIWQAARHFADRDSDALPHVFVNGVGFDLAAGAPEPGLGRHYAYTLGSPTPERDFFAGLSDRSSALLRRVVRIGLDADTDQPCGLQIYEVVEGRCIATSRELEDGYFTGRTSTRHQSLTETLQDAADANVVVFEFGGLADDEALELFSAHEFTAIFAKLAEVHVNGRVYERYGGSWVELEEY